MAVGVGEDGAVAADDVERRLVGQNCARVPARKHLDGFLVEAPALGVRSELPARLGDGSAAFASSTLTRRYWHIALADFDRIRLLFGPSPVHRLERLSEHLGGKVEIWAKREDCNSGLAYGGNKVRKLEYLAADAIAQGCDTLVSIGGVQSNHTRQVAAVAAHLGLKCIVQERWVRVADVVYDRVGASCCRGSWARTCASTRPASSGSDRVGSRRSPRSRSAAAKPYAIPPARTTHSAGSGSPVGPRGRRAGRRSRRLLRHDRRLLGHRLDPGG